MQTKKNVLQYIKCTEKKLEHQHHTSTTTCYSLQKSREGMSSYSVTRVYLVGFHSAAISLTLTIIQIIRDPTNSAYVVSILTRAIWLF